MAVAQQKKKVVVTGASGFLGSQIVQKLLEAELDVRAVLRDGAQHRELPSWVTSSAVFTRDVFNEKTSWWEAVCEGSFAVVHTAWFTTPGEYVNSIQNLACLSGSLPIAEGAIAAGVKRFVGIGSCFEYDLSQGPASIETPLLPKTLYAGTKVALFHVLQNLFSESKSEFVWARLFYLFGVGENDRRLFPYLKNQLSKGLPAYLSDGDQVRDYLDVEVAARRIVELLLGHQTGPVNVCSGEGVSVREFAERVAHSYQRNDLLVFGARERNQFDPNFAVGRVGTSKPQ